jgi:hypothetical protein
METKFMVCRNAPLLLGVVLCAAAIPWYAQAQELPAKFATTVQLSISYRTDGTMKTQITSFLSRELRGLGDVTVVDDNGHYLISVVGLTLVAGGKTAGFALATVYLRASQKAEWATDKWFHDMTGVEKIELWRLDVLRELFRHGPEFLDSQLHTGQFSSLQKICQEIVADFDTTILDSARKNWDWAHKPADKE